MLASGSFTAMFDFPNGSNAAMELAAQLAGKRAAENLRDEPLDEPEESNGEIAVAEAEAGRIEIKVAEEVQP